MGEQCVSIVVRISYRVWWIFLSVPNRTDNPVTKRVCIRCVCHCWRVLVRLEIETVGKCSDGYVSLG